MKSMHFLLAAMLLTPAAPALADGLSDGSDLGGSWASLVRVHKVAKREDYTFLRTAADVWKFVQLQRLEKITSTPDFFVKKVSFPYARPAVKLFLERLGAQYRAATGDRLVITSLTRPLSRQPRNASALSVHPTGMAVDLRMPRKAAHRRWLERTLLSLEDKVVLDVTRERNPAHYHVAVFPRQYERYVARLSQK